MSDPPVSTLVVSLEQFTALLDRCQWPLYTFLRGMVGDDEQARDLMQDTFYDAWRTAQQGNPPFDRGSAEEAGMRRWLFHAAYNRACSALRRRRIISWLPLESSNRETVEDCSFESQIAENQAVRSALASLSPADASCLLLIVVHSFTAAEVSQIVGASPQAVAKRFSRAKQRLRDAYLAQNVQPETRLHS
jgi:RNA polymerase sigma-70 factor, ECF subfamily